MNRSIPAVLIVALAFTAFGCTKKPKYDISAQPPADCLASGQCVPAPPTGEACPTVSAGAGAAYDYLTAICACGHRRTGTAAHHCAAAFVRDELKALGYEVIEQTFTFPYYQFDEDQTSVVRVRDGKNFPAYPMHYSMPPKEKLVGKLVRPCQNLKGNFVLAPSALTGYDLKAHYEEWVKKGAIGVVVAADLSPIAAKGMRHSRNAHSLSWHYAPLPGFVVERPEQLLGATIEAFHNGRIVPGAGVNVIARGPVGTGRPVLVTAHLDSWFEGALDDGSGVAALLAAARKLRGTKDVIFAAVDAEEIGLIGSANLSLMIDPADVKAIVELDMVSSVDTYFGDRRGGTSPRIVTVSPGLRLPAMRRFDPLPGAAIYPGSRFARGLTNGFSSDIEWYYTRGVPGVFVYVPSYYYHTEKDTIASINPADLNAMGETVAGLVQDLGAAPEIKAPREVIPFTFKAAPAAGDTVEFTVTPGRGFITGLPATVSVVVYWNFGFEKRVELAKGPDGAYHGQFRLTRPGDWQFLAIVSQHGRGGKRWKEYVR